MRQDYQRAILRAIATAGSKGKRPARIVVLNAAAAALGVADRDGLSTTLSHLEEVGFVAERDDRRLMLTVTGENVDSELSPEQRTRLTDFLAVAHKAQVEALDRRQLEVLYLVAVAEHHGVQIGASTVGEVLNIASGVASSELTSLTEQGHLVEVPVRRGIEVYNLTKSGRFALRRGEFRVESIRYPESRSERAQELISSLMEAMGD